MVCNNPQENTDNIGQTKLTCEPGSHSCSYQGEITITLVTLFIVSLTINIIVLAVWLHKKRKTRNKNDKMSEFEVEGNPCYEAIQMQKQMSDAETHAYEMVREKKGNQ